MYLGDPSGTTPELRFICGGFRPYLSKSFASEVLMRDKNREMVTSAGSWNQLPEFLLQRDDFPMEQRIHTFSHNQRQIIVLHLPSR